MARRGSTPPAPQPAVLSPAQIEAGIERLQKRLADVKTLDPTSVIDQYNIPEIEALSAALEDTLQRTYGADTADYLRYKPAAQFDNGPHNYAYEVPISEVHASLSRSKARSIALLQQAIQSLEERRAESGGQAAPRRADALSRRVFVVHGHDDGAREAVARFLEKLGFDAIILHEQASKGRTVIEKVEEHGDVGFAVILLTPDDEGRAIGENTLRPRARQNVLLELGYFVGRLGRDRVCALKRGDLEVPSDFGGVVWVPFDNSNGWKMSLGKEFEAAGFAVDWNDVMR